MRSVGNQKTVEPKYRGFDAMEISTSDDSSTCIIRTILVKHNLLFQTIESPHRRSVPQRRVTQAHIFSIAVIRAVNVTENFATSPEVQTPQLPHSAITF